MHRGVFVPRICSLIDRSSGEGFTDRFLRRLVSQTANAWIFLEEWCDMTRRFQRICIFTPNLGERIKFDSNIFETGGSTHRLDDIWCDIDTMMILDATWMFFVFVFWETPEKNGTDGTTTSLIVRRASVESTSMCGSFLAASAAFACLCRYEIHSGWLVGWLLWYFQESWWPVNVYGMSHLALWPDGLNRSLNRPRMCFEKDLGSADVGRPRIHGHWAAVSTIPGFLNST